MGRKFTEQDFLDARARYEDRMARKAAEQASYKLTLGELPVATPAARRPTDIGGLICKALAPCEACRLPIVGEHYSDVRSSEVGRGVVLCQTCCDTMHKWSDGSFRDWAAEQAFEQAFNSLEAEVEVEVEVDVDLSELPDPHEAPTRVDLHRPSIAKTGPIGPLVEPFHRAAGVAHRPNGRY